jgi:hypothetical protein
MNYSQAKALARNRAQQTRIDQVISFDGVNYTVHKAPKYNGNITEVVKYSKPKKSTYVATKKSKAKDDGETV